MERRIAIVSMILKKPEAVPQLNAILHDYQDCIIGRMGIPYKKRGISIISIVMDSPQDIISTFSGKLGKLEGVSAKTAYSKYVFND